MLTKNQLRQDIILNKIKHHVVNGYNVYYPLIINISTNNLSTLLTYPIQKTKRDRQRSKQVTV